MYEGDATATQPADSLLSLDTKAELPISASCVPVPTLVGSTREVQEDGRRDEVRRL